MSAEIVLRPGRVSLAEWRAIYRGARVVLDPASRADIEAGAAALDAIVGRKELLQLPENGNGAPAASDVSRDLGQQSAALSRLFIALKLASLAQGMSGVRWEVVEYLAENLAQEVLPLLPAGNLTDRAALSLLVGSMAGKGDVASCFTPQERRALISGTQLTIASALAGLFEAERAIQSAIVAAALAASGQSLSFLTHPRIHELQRQAGQLEVATALRALLGVGKAGDERKENGLGGVDTLIKPSRLGACLDLLRQAGETLEGAANAVTESHVVLWHTGETVAGIEDCSSAALAADLVAMALREISDLAKRRVSAIASPDPAGVNGNGEAGPRAMANAILGEIRRNSYPTGFDASGARRLLPMAGNVMRVMAIEVLLGVQQKPAEPLRADVPCEAARRILREAMPRFEEGADIEPEALVVAVDLVSSGALARAPGVALPSVVP